MIVKAVGREIPRVLRVIGHEDLASRAEQASDLDRRTIEIDVAWDGKRWQILERQADLWPGHVG